MSLSHVRNRLPEIQLFSRMAVPTCRALAAKSPLAERWILLRMASSAGPKRASVLQNWSSCSCINHIASASSIKTRPVARSTSRAQPPLSGHDSQPVGESLG
jgi:hypothetical protein